MPSTEAAGGAAGFSRGADVADEFSVREGEVGSAIEDLNDIEVVVNLVAGGGFRGIVQGIAEFDKESIRREMRQLVAHVGDLTFIGDAVFIVREGLDEIRDTRAELGLELLEGDVLAVL